jgi:hypothetical protein
LNCLGWRRIGRKGFEKSFERIFGIFCGFEILAWEEKREILEFFKIFGSLILLEKLTNEMNLKIYLFYSSW